MGAMTRRSRFFTALVAATALVFAQLAATAFACPMESPSPAIAQGDCDEVMMNTNLCQNHCDYGSASFEAAKPVHASPVALPACLRLDVADVAAASIAAPSPFAAPGPAPPPPLARFTVLRI